MRKIIYIILIVMFIKVNLFGEKVFKPSPKAKKNIKKAKLILSNNIELYLTIYFLQAEVIDFFNRSRLLGRSKINKYKNKDNDLNFYFKFGLSGMNKEDDEDEYFKNLIKCLFFYSNENNIKKIENYKIINKRVFTKNKRFNHIEENEKYVFFDVIIIFSSCYKQAIEENRLYFNIIKDYDETKKEEYIKDFIKLNTSP